MNKILYSLVLTIFLFVNNETFAQLNNNLDESFQKVIEYIASNDFKKLKNTYDHLSLVDSIYIKALEISEGDISENLLALTFATLPFDKMVVGIPVINSTVNLQLQEVDSVLFKTKNVNLPSQLFFDSPLNGDKDKLAHFFGNAFLSYNFSVFNISKILGIFVELFEESFLVSGGLDSRDITVNYLGEFYGKMLNNNNKLLPSEVLSLYSLMHIKIYN
ncbi:MAG: hypothetical protein A2068_13125 [Ignavibacteria bacterium GWB2_35_6b]|nr:MAG: hypothetical protein A2068_13125 [Ignavibacteria bacterium GWB2_35_6b]